MPTPSAPDTKSAESIDTPAFEELVSRVHRGEAKLCHLVAFIQTHQARVVSDAVAPLEKALELESAALAEAVRHVDALKTRQAFHPAIGAMDASACKPIGYAPDYLPQRFAAGDAAVMLTVTRNQIPALGATIPLFTEQALAGLSIKTYQQGFDAGKAYRDLDGPGAADYKALFDAWWTDPQRQGSTFGWHDSKESVWNLVREQSNLAWQAAIAIPGAAAAQISVLRAALSTVRQYPDFDGETAMGRLIDEALAGKAPKMLTAMDQLAPLSTTTGEVLAEVAEKITCSSCRGTGQSDCTDCNGKGFHWEPIEQACSQESPPSGMGTEQEPKYGIRDGRLFNRASGEHIPPEEPVFIFRARDSHSVNVLASYARAVADQAHAKAVWRRVEDFKAFWNKYPERMKAPDTVVGSVQVLPASVDSKLGGDQMLRDALKMALESSTTGQGSYGPNYDGHKLAAAVKAALAAPQPAPGVGLDTKMLNYIEDATVDVRCHSSPTGGDDFDIVWSVIEHHMAAPHERQIGWGTNVREAISNAMNPQPEADE